MILFTAYKEMEKIRHILDEKKDYAHEIPVSLTIKVAPADPLLFYQSGRKPFAGRSFFWESPSGGLVAAGLGVAAEIRANAGPRRFKKVMYSWAKLKEQMIRIGETGSGGTGPILFGGFSFDDRRETAEPWTEFGHGLFYLPAFLLTSLEGQSYLTISIRVRPGDPVDEIFQRMIAEADDLLQKTDRTFSISRNPLVKKEEQSLEKWSAMVNAAIGDMKAGIMHKVVLARTQKLVFKDRHNPGAIVQTLRERQHGNYIFCLESAEDCFIGATPERLIQKKGRDVLSTCLAGSTGRGRDREADDKLGRDLLQDRKNLKEHRYVVSMVGKVFTELCSDVRIPDRPVLLKNRDIQHLYTPVRGICPPNVTLFDLLECLHPTPALGGLPKMEALKWIRDHEETDRGLYGSPIGWCDTEGNGEFAVGIRSALVHGNEATLFAGCGVLKESVPEKEYAETAMKFRPMLGGLGDDSDESC